MASKKNTVTALANATDAVVLQHPAKQEKKPRASKKKKEADPAPVGDTTPAMIESAFATLFAGVGGEVEGVKITKETFAGARRFLVDAGLTDEQIDARVLDHVRAALDPQEQKKEEKTAAALAPPVDEVDVGEVDPTHGVKAEPSKEDAKKAEQLVLDGATPAEAAMAVASPVVEKKKAEKATSGHGFAILSAYSLAKREGRDPVTAMRSTVDLLPEVVRAGAIKIAISKEDPNSDCVRELKKMSGEYASAAPRKGRGVNGFSRKGTWTFLRGKPNNAYIDLHLEPEVAAGTLKMGAVFDIKKTRDEKTGLMTITMTERAPVKA